MLTTVAFCTSNLRLPFPLAFPKCVRTDFIDFVTWNYYYCSDVHIFALHMAGVCVCVRGARIRPEFNALYIISFMLIKSKDLLIFWFLIHVPFRTAYSFFLIHIWMSNNGAMGARALQTKDRKFEQERTQKISITLNWKRYYMHRRRLPNQLSPE